MTDALKIVGQWGTTPQDGGLLRSGAPSLLAPISEFVTLDAKNDVEYDLVADAAQVVAFGGVVNAAVVIINSDRKVRARLTSADGATQSIPVDGMVMLISRTVPITAIDLTRVPATETRVKVFLGEKA